MLDDHRISLVVSKNDASLLVLVNKVGARQSAFPTFVTYLGSFAFRARKHGMVLDFHSQIREEPIANEHKHAIGFLTCTTATHNLREGHLRFLLE